MDFVPGCGKAWDHFSSSMQVCSLKMLPPDTRLTFGSGLLTLGRRFDVISSDNDGNVCEGARPGSWLYMLFDLGNCEICFDTLGSVLLPPVDSMITPCEVLRCFPWNSGFGVRLVADEAFVALPSFSVRSRLSFDSTTFFCSDPFALLVSLGGGGNALLDLLVPGVSVHDGNLTKGVPSARVIRRGSGQDCGDVSST